MNAAGGPFVLQAPTDFSRSMLWQLQQRYFSERGVEAWRQGEVPHYVTSNPTIANCYAEIVLAFWRDRQRLDDSPPDDDPLHICEIGGGSGRFAFYFLRRLMQLCKDAGIRPDAFRYVLTDVAESNLEFWRGHSCLAPFFAAGILDVAQFDLTQPGDLTLQVNGKTIGQSGLSQPLVAIANYVFDGIPQDLLHVVDGRCHPCQVSLTINERTDDLNPADLLARLRVGYDDAPPSGALSADPRQQRIIDQYADILSGSYVLFPAAALHGLDHMAQLSRHGLLLLSADKGEHRLDALDRRSPPNPVRHGSVSLPVNYHAFTSFCEHGGGLALVPAGHAHSINVIALLMMADAATHTETHNAYRRHVLEFGPDSFFTITRHARQTIPQMTVEDILAYLQLSRHDSHQFGRYLPRLQQLATEFSDAERRDVVAAIEQVWEQYFPLGEQLDLANQIATLLYAMDDYVPALVYFARSNDIYGEDTGTLHNMAACHHLLGQDEAATALLQRALELEPGNAEAAVLLGRIRQPLQASQEG